MKKIDISTLKHPNTFAIVDDEDFEYLNQWKWRVQKTKRKHGVSIAVTRTDESGVKKTCIYMHRVIMGNPKKKYVNNISHNELDLRKENLRICNNVERSFNIKSKTGRLIYKGVSWSKVGRKWVATIGFQKKIKYLGLFKSEKEAALAYNEKAKELFGEFAYLNEVSDD